MTFDAESLFAGILRERVAIRDTESTNTLGTMENVDDTTSVQTP